MQRIIPLAAVLVISLFLFGCGQSGTLSSSYSPQNLVRLEGRADMGEFSYTPFTEGKVKKPNQIKNTAIGSIYLPTDIADYVKRATGLELEKSGIVLEANAPIKIGGDVLEFKADDFGYSVDWSYSIKYRITSNESGKVIFEKTFTPPTKRTGKFGLPTDVADGIVLSGYEMFVKDPAVQKIFKESLPTTVPVNTTTKK